MTEQNPPQPRFLHDIPVQEVLARKRWKRDDWIVFAFDAMENGGLGALTIDELARRSDRTKGSFYAHFASRDELLEAMLQEWIAAKLARTARFDSELFYRDEFSISGLVARLRDGEETARPNLDIAIREWARQDDRAMATVMRLDMKRMNNATAMLQAEFPQAAHPQVFALIMLWVSVGRTMVFLDPKYKALGNSDVLAMNALIEMYRSTAGDFKVPGAARWEGHFEPVIQKGGAVEPAPAARRRSARKAS